MTVTLTEQQRIPTSGARAVQPFTVDGLDLLAVPQLALDVPGGPVGMNGGDSETELLLLRRQDRRYVPFATLPAPGGEDAEFFTVNGRAFLAVASIRSGSGPYAYVTNSWIHEWVDGRFVPFQAVPTFAAKQWKHWTVGDRHFLGLAQGVSLPHVTEPNRDSVIMEWDGTSFVPFQDVPSRWAYNWHAFSMGSTSFLAHADHLDGARLLRWDGNGYVPHQPLLERAARAFATFERQGHYYLLVAGLEDPPRLLRWDSDRFAPLQQLEGLGARELTVFERAGRLFVARVNFILGTPQQPRPSLLSQVYAWGGGGLHVVAEFPTCGGTDVAVVDDGDDLQLLVSNALTPEVRFAASTVVYAVHVGDDLATSDRPTFAAAVARS